jgi:hypothetical protein
MGLITFDRSEILARVKTHPPPPPCRMDDGVKENIYPPNKISRNKIW